MGRKSREMDVEKKRAEKIGTVSKMSLDCYGMLFL